MSPILYRIVVPLIRRNGQPMFKRRSFCSTFTLHPDGSVHVLVYRISGDRKGRSLHLRDITLGAR